VTKDNIKEKCIPPCCYPVVKSPFAIAVNISASMAAYRTTMLILCTASAWVTVARDYAGACLAGSAWVLMLAMSNPPTKMVFKLFGILGLM
jgi:hypothetical protein